MTQADFLQFLSKHGLTAVDGARTIEQLKQQYGVGRWYDFIEVVYLPLSPLFPGKPRTVLCPVLYTNDFSATGRILL